MRKFLVITSTPLIDKYFGIHARILVASLLISRSIRRNSILYLYLSDVDTIIKFVGDKMRQLRADEYSAFGIIEKAIKYLKRKGFGKPHDGVFIEKKSIEDVLSGTKLILVKSSQGLLLSNVLSKLCVDNVLYVTYVENLGKDIREILNLKKIQNFLAIKFPKDYLPEQEIVIIHNVLDLLGCC